MVVMTTVLESTTSLFFYRFDHNHKDLGSGWEALMVVMTTVLESNPVLFFFTD